MRSEESAFEEVPAGWRRALLSLWKQAVQMYARHRPVAGVEVIS